MWSSQDELAAESKDLTPTFINILLLGETGVGKSTFINSFANYLTYSDFSTVQREDLITLIPLKFTIQDKHGEYHIVHIGSEHDQNECLDTGMSATQDVKSYVFPLGNGDMKIRLIDTPGIGDVRGIDQDNINCENIVSYMEQLDELHAICYMFKPTHSRKTVYFDYCLSQILSRLEKTASKNIIFIFTNTRGTHYGPGDTFPNLEKIVEDIKSKYKVNIPLNTNTFCFDNEAFRYLASATNNIEFDDFVKQRNNESWSQSVAQCKKLITYIIGDNENQPLRPYFTRRTNTINKVQRLVTQFSKLLSEISQVISDNSSSLQRHKENLDLESAALNDLKLFVPVTDIEEIKIAQPILVCASKNCTEIYKVKNINKRHYKQVCQNPCYVTASANEIIGSPELINCAVIDNATKACKICECDFSSHMQVSYLTRKIKRTIVDNGVLEDIYCKNTLIKNTTKLITECETQNDGLEKEYNTIANTCKRFAHFLMLNVIVPFSDSYKEYIEYLIMREKSLGALSNKSIVQHLQKLLQEHEPLKQIFNDNHSLGRNIDTDNKKNTFLTLQTIRKSMHEMFEIQYNGKKIRELYQKSSHTQTHIPTEYVHDRIFKLDGIWSTNKSKNVLGCDNDFQRSMIFYNSSGQCEIENEGKDKWHNDRRRTSQSQTRFKISYLQSHSECDLYARDSESDHLQATSKKSGQWVQDDLRDDDQLQGNENQLPHQPRRIWLRGRGRGAKFRPENQIQHKEQLRHKQSDQTQDLGINESKTLTSRIRGRGNGHWQNRSWSIAPAGNNNQQQSQSRNEENNQSNGRSRGRTRGRGRGQWQNKYIPRNHSKTQAKNSDQQQSQFQDEESDQQNRNSRSRGRTWGGGKDQWQNNYTLRSQSKSQTENNGQQRSESEGEESDQSNRHSRSRGRTRGRVRGQWQNRSRSIAQALNRNRQQSQSQGEESDHSNRGSALGGRTRRGEKEQWQNNYTLRGQLKSETENNVQKRSESQGEESNQPNTRSRSRGRTRGGGRGQWQNNYTLRNQSKNQIENIFPKQSQSRDEESDQSETGSTRSQSPNGNYRRKTFQCQNKDTGQSTPQVKATDQIFRSSHRREFQIENIETYKLQSTNSYSDQTQSKSNNTHYEDPLYRVINKNEANFEQKVSVVPQTVKSTNGNLAITQVTKSYKIIRAEQNYVQRKENYNWGRRMDCLRDSVEKEDRFDLKKIERGQSLIHSREISSPHDNGTIRSNRLTYNYSGVNQKGSCDLKTLKASHNIQMGKFKLYERQPLTHIRGNTQGIGGNLKNNLISIEIGQEANCNSNTIKKETNLAHQRQSKTSPKSNCCIL